MSRVERQCSLCHEKLSIPKQCSACKIAWYCGSKCQKRDWVRHIFDCKPSRPITTADHLALAVDRNLIPEHPQTRDDYGFTGADHETATMLLGLYIGLLDPNRLAVKPSKMHKWRLNGTLVENIKSEFLKIPDGSRGGYYAWFLQNQDLVGENLEKQGHLEAQVEGWLRQAWCFIGRSPSTSLDEIKQWQTSLSEEARDCFLLYAMLLAGNHPGPSDDSWITFGFCACECQEAEMELSQKYRVVIKATLFEDFCAAFKSSSLPTLFRDKGINITNPYMLDILSSWNCRKSVWLLKQYIENRTIVGFEDATLRPANSVQVDYGFINCKTADEHKLLFEVYKGFFAMGASANPLELHQACIGGRLFAYLTEGLGFKLKPKKYRRLLKNFYPLPDL